MDTRIHEILRSNQGVTIVFVAICLVVLLGIAALAIDIGNLTATKGELQRVSDSAALAGAGRLGEDYRTKSCNNIDFSAITNFINLTAEKNLADTKIISIRQEDVEFGCWNFSNRTFSPFNSTNCSCASRWPNAVKVVSRRDKFQNSPVQTFFARVFGKNSVDVSANAIASLSGTSASGLPFPVGISKYWFNPEHWAAEGKGFCDQPIKFHPTGTLDGCAGWNTFDSFPSNANKLRNILDGLADGSFSIPEFTTGDNLIYIGGNVASAFPNMKALYDAKKDPITNEWKVSVPVYDRNDCSNPSNAIAIVGFATAIITDVYGAPTQTIQAKVICDEFIPQYGGGSDFGTYGTIPSLVN